MYLSQLDVEGYRSLSRVSVTLGRDVSVLVGENNGGKSNVIDALRLLTDPIDGRRNLYLDRDDLFRGHGAGQVMLRATYTGSADDDLAAYQHAASPQLDRVLYSLRYTPPSAGQVRGQVDWVAGSGADPCDPQPRGRDRLRHVYLPPLRDAARDLGSGTGARIQTILDSLLTGPDPVRDADGDAVEEAGLLEFVRSRFGDVEAHPVIAAATGRIGTRLSRLTSGAYEQRTGLGFAATSVQALARRLRVRMADAGLVPREIAESGMGYANLLFIATVLAQLDAAREADLTLLLVEDARPGRVRLLVGLRGLAVGAGLAGLGRWHPVGRLFATGPLRVGYFWLRPRCQERRGWAWAAYRCRCMASVRAGSALVICSVACAGLVGFEPPVEAPQQCLEEHGTLTASWGQLVLLVAVGGH